MAAASLESPAAEERYRIAPQMRVYDALAPVLRPYVTFTTATELVSEVVSTDELGFRVSRHGDDRIDTSSWRDGDSLLLGGSYAFGVGATSDAATIASVLTRLTGRRHANLGIRAGNSTQELIAAIPFVRRARSIVVCSGMNNLLVAIQSLGRNELYGPLFFEGALARLATRSLWDLSAEGLGATPREDLVRELGRRARAALRGSTGRRGTVGAAAGAARAPDEARLQDAVDQALARHERDLAILAAAAPPDADVLFAVQAFARDGERTISTEEERLFAITDELQSGHWQTVKTAVAEVWPSYCEQLGDLCAAVGARCVDLNRDAFDGWCFVDRAHMTDRGYARASELIAEQMP